MSTKDITDRQVVEAYLESKRLAEGRARVDGEWPHEVLARRTGQAPKVCYRACERANLRGYIGFGVSLRSGWVTTEGMALLAG